LLSVAREKDGEKHQAFNAKPLPPFGFSSLGLVHDSKPITSYETYESGTNMSPKCHYQDELKGLTNKVGKSANKSSTLQQSSPQVAISMN